MFVLACKVNPLHRSLEQEIESNKEDMSAILQIKDQLQTRSQECLELVRSNGVFVADAHCYYKSTAYEEIEKENVESVRTDLTMQPCSQTQAPCSLPSQPRQSRREKMRSGSSRRRSRGTQWRRTSWSAS